MVQYLRLADMAVLDSIGSQAALNHEGDSMKFTNGMWLDKEDCKISYPSEAYSADIVDNCLVIYAPYVKVTH